MQSGCQFLPGSLLEGLSRKFFNAFFGHVAKILVAPRFSANPHDGVVFRKQSVQDKIVHGRKQLPAREISGPPENDKRTRLNGRVGRSLHV